MSEELAALEAAISTCPIDDQRPAILIDGSLGDIEVIREALCANAMPGSGDYQLYTYNTRPHILEWAGPVDEISGRQMCTAKRITVDVLTRLLLDHFNVFKVVREPLLGQLVRKPSLPSARILSTVLSYSNWPGMRARDTEPGLYSCQAQAPREDTASR